MSTFIRSSFLIRPTSQTHTFITTSLSHAVASSSSHTAPPSLLFRPSRCFGTSPRTRAAAGYGNNSQGKGQVPAERETTSHPKDNKKAAPGAKSVKQEAGRQGGAKGGEVDGANKSKEFKDAMKQKEGARDI
ncbi:hypothetical protein HKX48_002645 [Thoreauomyces humboldtii]|nr:hypothetical protein HKX48_002645 [Thoreauomyces humboldtii]